MTPSLHREPFGHLPGGDPVERITLGDGTGFAVGIIGYGAAVQTLMVPDRDGRVADVVLGHDTLDAYLAQRRFFGATIGRYANRIAGGRFLLDGTTHAIGRNDAGHALHGGDGGFDRHPWTVEAAHGLSPSVTLSRVSPDGEEGFPGRMHARITYSLPAPGTLAMEWQATTDRPTVVNLTHHGFFNLAGVAGDEGILDHVLTVAADEYLPIDDGAIPLGDPAPVAGTPFDFRAPMPIGARIRTAHGQLRRGRGYDHNFCLVGGRTAQPRVVARIVHPPSGRSMELSTDQPGLQVYSGNFLDGAAPGKYGRLHRQSDALCLEPQAWPDTPNRAGYPSARLDPGQTYRHRTVFRFGITP